MLKTASKAAPRTRHTSKKVASAKKTKRKQTVPRFIGVLNDRVIFQHESLSDAMDDRLTKPGSVIFGAMSDGDRVETSQRPEVRPNPLGRVLEDLSARLEECIGDVISTAMERPDAVSDGIDNYGIVHEEREIVRLKERTATNLECAFWNVDLALKGRFDLRKPLPRQAATWLRGLAARMTKAAAAVEQLVDDRKRSIIRKLVDEEAYLPSLEAQFMRFNDDGTLEKDENAEYKATQKKGGAV